MKLESQPKKNSRSQRLYFLNLITQFIIIHLKTKNELIFDKTKLMIKEMRLKKRVGSELFDLLQLVVSPEGHLPELFPVLFCVWVELFGHLWSASVNGPKPVWILRVRFNLQ